MKLNKNIKKIFLLLIVIIFIIKGYKVFIKEYKITYKIGNYKITEYFYQKEGHNYDLIIKNKNQIYTYSIKNNFNKEKKIIKKINPVKQNKLSCIIPIYINEIEKNIYCNLDNNQISIDYLIKSNNEDFIKIKEKVKKLKIKYPTTSNKKITTENITYYPNNMLENHIYYIWNYKKIHSFTNKLQQEKEFLKEDLYDNIMSTTISGYYIIFDNTSVNGIKTCYAYSYKNNKVKEIELEKTPSKDSYINGVYKNKIYITDRKEKKQYILDIKNEKIEELKEYITYQNNKKKVLSVSDFFINDQLFNNDNKISNYTYYQEENKIYKKLENTEYKILLLELDNISEWKIIDDEIIIIKDDTIYSYTDEYGLRKIIETNELKYNYKNIYEIGKK